MSFIKDRLENVSRSVGMHAAGYYDASARRGWLARKGELLGEETRANGLMFALADCVSVVCLQELPCETMEWAFADRGIAARVLEPRDLVAVIWVRPPVRDLGCVVRGIAEPDHARDRLPAVLADPLAGRNAAVRRRPGA